MTNESFTINDYINFTYFYNYKEAPLNELTRGQIKINNTTKVFMSLLPMIFFLNEKQKEFFIFNDMKKLNSKVVNKSLNITRYYSREVQSYLYQWLITYLNSYKGNFYLSDFDIIFVIILGLRFYYQSNILIDKEKNYYTDSYYALYPLFASSNINEKVTKIIEDVCIKYSKKDERFSFLSKLILNYKIKGDIKLESKMPDIWK